MKRVPPLASIRRALEHHERTGAIRSVASAGGDVSRPGSANRFMVGLRNGDYVELSRHEAYAMCLGLASAEKRWQAAEAAVLRDIGDMNTRDAAVMYEVAQDVEEGRIHDSA